MGFDETTNLINKKKSKSTSLFIITIILCLVFNFLIGYLDTKMTVDSHLLYKDFDLGMMFIFGILLSIPFHIYINIYKKKALTKIHFAYPSEYIIQVLEFSAFIKYATSFFVFGFLGGIILPQILYNNINIYLITLAILWFISLLAIFYVYSFVVVLTNKRVLKTYSFEFINKRLQKIDIEYSDIETLDLLNFSMSGKIFIRTNNKVIEIGSDKNIKKFYGVMKNIKEENNL